ncbi:MAG TPA: hypothetical protein VKI41_19310 [Vicinamibacteria bacterium]|nr:hypothetical protein [Vicinamibacteria bacterium]
MPARVHEISTRGDELFPESPSEFFLKSQDVQVRFEKDANGSVSKLVIIQPGGTLDAKRLP